MVPIDGKAAWLFGLALTDVLIQGELCRRLESFEKVISY
jgi:hypothetical protein